MNGKGQLRLSGRAAVSIGKRLTQNLGDIVGGEHLEKMRRSLGVETVQEWTSPPRLAGKPRQAIALLLPYLESAYLSYGLGDAIGLAVNLCRSWGIKNSKAWSVTQGRANLVMEKLAESGWGSRRERPRFVDYDRFVTSLATTPLRMGDDEDTMIGVGPDGVTAAVSDPKKAISVFDALLTGAAEVTIDLDSLRNLCALKRLPEAKLAETEGALEWVRAVPDLAPAVLLAAMEVFGYREGGGRNGAELNGWPNLDLRYVSDRATNFAVEATKEMRKVLLTEDPMARAAIYWRFVSDPASKGSKAFTDEAAGGLARAWEAINKQNGTESVEALSIEVDGVSFNIANVLARWDHLQKEAQAIQTDIVTGHIDTLEAMVTWWSKWKEGKRKLRGPMERERLGKRNKAAEVPAVMTSKAHVAGDVSDEAVAMEAEEASVEPTVAPTAERQEMEKILDRASEYVGEMYEAKDGRHYKVVGVAEYFIGGELEAPIPPMMLISAYNTESGGFSDTPSFVMTLEDLEGYGLQSGNLKPLVSDAELEKSIEDGTAEVGGN